MDYDFKCVDKIILKKTGKLNEKQIWNILMNYEVSGGMVPYFLAEAYGVSKQTIYRWCRIDHVREYQRNWCRMKSPARVKDWFSQKPLDCLECQNKITSTRKDVSIERDTTDYYVVRCPHCGRRTQRFATPNLAISMWNADTIYDLRERMKAKNGK